MLNLASLADLAGHAERAALGPEQTPRHRPPHEMICALRDFQAAAARLRLRLADAAVKDAEVYEMVVSVPCAAVPEGFMDLRDDCAN